MLTTAHQQAPSSPMVTFSDQVLDSFPQIQVSNQGIHAIDQVSYPGFPSGLGLGSLSAHAVVPIVLLSTEREGGGVTPNFED